MGTPPSVGEWRPRRTLIDLYNEKDQTPWSFRLLATVSALMLAFGFLIFPSSYTQSANSTVTSLSALSAAIALILFSFIITTLLAIYLKSWIFHLDILYMPHLGSSVLGLLNTIYAIASHRNILGSSTSSAHYAIAALVLSILATIGYGFLSLFTFRRIYIVRARDALHRQTTPSATKEFLPETEQQRKQLLRLLIQQEESRESNPDNTTSHTFKIDWPGNHNNGNDRSHRNTLNTLRNFPRFSRYGASRVSHFGGPPADHLTGGIERVPTVIQEESTLESIRSGRANQTTNRPAVVVTSSHNNPTARTTPSTGVPRSANPTSPRPAAFIPRGHSALFNTAGAEGGDRAPSYCENAHPSMYLDVARRGSNGYPADKPRVYDQPDGRGHHQQQQQQRNQGGGLRLAAQDGMHPNEREREREQFELADRGREGTRIRPELDGWGEDGGRF